MSITTLMASLPPASLAEADLARFCAQALGRRTRSELPGLAALFSEESLRGYPQSLGPILQALVLTIIQHSVDPNGLDARTIDGLLGSAGFLARLEKKTSVTRQRLRPGTIVGAALRQTLGMRLLVLPGVGRELVLVAPVDLAQVADAHFAVPLGVVLARPAPPEEAEVLRASWAVIEERFGLDGDAAAEWCSRFLAIARLENHDAQGAAERLEGLPYEQRMVIWETLVAHLRDGELPEQHRTGRRGLDRRIGELGYSGQGSAIPDWIEATFSLVESVYRAAGLDPEVMAGRCPAPREDIERWGGWVDVPAAGRDRVRRMSPEAIEMALVRLAEEEAGRMERSPDMPETLVRALASLRDGCLRPRWQRSRLALTGIDPLLLARARIASGEDTHAIRRRLEALAHDASLVERVQPVGVKTRTVEARGESRGDSSGDMQADSSSDTIGSELRSAEQARSLQGHHEGVDPSAVSIELREAREAREPIDPEQASNPDGRGLRASRFHLPPLPSVPPPRPAPRVRARTDFPPMPVVPPRAVGPRTSELDSTARPATEQRVARSPDPSPSLAARAPSLRLPSQRMPTANGRPSTASPSSAASPGAAILPAPIARATVSARLAPPEATASPRIARPRTGATAPHLVTPTQGNHFYDASFRELELIERDLLQRGPYGGAAERVQAIAAEAAELHSALGPSARSGDREFQATQRRIEKVQAYLERVRPLLVARAPDSGPRDPDVPSSGFLGRLFGKRK